MLLLTEQEIRDSVDMAVAIDVANTATTPLEGDYSIGPATGSPAAALMYYD